MSAYRQATAFGPALIASAIASGLAKARQNMAVGRKRKPKKSNRARHPLQRENEITYVEWLDAEALRKGVTRSGIYCRIATGKYPELKRTLRRINGRVAFVAL